MLTLSWPRRESRTVASSIRSSLCLAEAGMLGSQNFQDLTLADAKLQAATFISNGDAWPS